MRVSIARVQPKRLGYGYVKSTRAIEQEGVAGSNNFGITVPKMQSWL